MTWNLIETPPKAVGVYLVTYRVTFRRGIWDAPLETEYRVTPLRWDGEWNCLGSPGRTGFAYDVTHWMPLPQPATTATPWYEHHLGSPGRQLLMD